MGQCTVGQRHRNSTLVKNIQYFFNIFKYSQSKLCSDSRNSKATEKNSECEINFLAQIENKWINIAPISHQDQDYRSGKEILFCIRQIDEYRFFDFLAFWENKESSNKFRLLFLIEVLWLPERASPYKRVKSCLAAHFNGVLSSKAWALKSVLIISLSRKEKFVKYVYHKEIRKLK